MTSPVMGGENHKAIENNGDQTPDKEDPVVVGGGGAVDGKDYDTTHHHGHPGQGHQAGQGPGHLVDHLVRLKVLEAHLEKHKSSSLLSGREALLARQARPHSTGTDYGFGRTRARLPPAGL